LKVRIVFYSTSKQNLIHTCCAFSSHVLHPFQAGNNSVCACQQKLVLAVAGIVLCTIWKLIAPHTRFFLYNCWDILWFSCHSHVGECIL
jgi:hypothetical protein